MIDAWRRLRPGARLAVGIFAAIVGLNLLTAGVSTITGGSGPSGPTSSSYATADDGLAGYAELLARHGHAVDRLRVSLDRAGLDPATTLIVADPTGLGRDEVDAVATFVRAGGRLVAAGPGVEEVLAGLPAGGPSWGGGDPGPAQPVVPVPEVAGVATVETAGDGVWLKAGGTVPLVAGRGGVLATVLTLGAGRVVAVADASPFQNRLLGHADNAAFALAVVGEGRPATFAEAQHGYGRSTGLGALPVRWRWALAGALLATLVWMWSRSRRLGPPDDVERSEPPARRAYVEAMAGALAKTRQPDVAMAPLQERARRRLAARAGLVPDAGEVELRHAAGQLSLPADEVDALFTRCRNDADVLAAGRAMARLTEQRR